MQQLELASALEEKFNKAQQDPSLRKHCFIGFDGVTDDIIGVVERRENFDHYTLFDKMDGFGKRIEEASGRSCNFELILKRRKIGGNGPILANALVEGCHEITFVGTFGLPNEIEPLFQDLTKRCKKVIPLGPSASTQALEFSDGKILLGKLKAFEQATYANLLKQLPLPELQKEFEQCNLFVSANWTMLYGTSDIWRQLLKDVVPGLSQRPAQNRRWLYIDLADPSKRPDVDLSEALMLLEKFSERFSVVLGLNAAEAKRIATVAGVNFEGGDKEKLLKTADALRTKLKMSIVALHSPHYAVAAGEEGSFDVDGPYCPKPRLATGAGDNFNAGFCNGLLHGFGIQEALLLAVATSGSYVREAKSPNISELANFLRLWYNNQLN